MLRRPLCTLHDARYRAPCNTRSRLAGCAFTGRESNPLARYERFLSHCDFLLSRASPGAIRDPDLEGAGTAVIGVILPLLLVI